MFVVFEGLMWGLSRLPWGLWHLFSDFLAVILAYVIRYRESTIVANLKICFPEKDETWINNTKWQFYRHFADVLVEVVKTSGLSLDEFKQHIQFEGENVFLPHEAKSQNVIGWAYHFCNWEWVALASNLLSKHDCYTVYKPLSNLSADEWIRSTRAVFGSKLLPFKKIREVLKQYEDPNSGRIMMLGMAADQRPHKKEVSIEVNFFGRRTLFFHGAAVIAVQKDWPGIIATVRKVGRSRYIWAGENLIPVDILVDGPEQQQVQRIAEANGLTLDQAAKAIGIVQAYANRLEVMIREQPAYWLWAHKRWKGDYK